VNEIQAEADSGEPHSAAFMSEFQPKTVDGRIVLDYFNLL